MTDLNALHYPWVPLEKGGVTTTLSLRDALVRAHEFDGISKTLAPVEYEAMLRFLTSAAAVVVRDHRVSVLASEKRIPVEAVDTFAATFDYLFNLRDADRPFLQEWHVTAALDDKNAKPLGQLHVHVPGGSSSPWGLRQEHRPASDPAILLLLLVLTWFHGKPSNAGFPDCFAGKSISGAPSGGAYDTSFHLIGSTFAETLLANTLRAWVSSDDTLPAWLDQDAVPDDLSEATCLWRSTWTPNRPLVLWDEETPLRYVKGLTRRPIPALAENFKDSAKAIHESDYAHIWHNTAKEDAEPSYRAVLAPVGVLSTEGAVNWYRKGFDHNLVPWGSDRVITKANVDRIGFHNERGDTYGTRSHSEFIETELDVLSATGERRDAIWAVLGFADTLRQKVSAPMSRASASDPALVKFTQRDFYATIDPIVLGTLTASRVDVVSLCESVATAAKANFRSHIRVLATPATFFMVEEAIARFETAVRYELAKTLKAHSMPQQPVAAFKANATPKENVTS